MTNRIASLVALAAVVAQPAAADDFVFKGDCERARIVQAERTIDKLMPYATYRGTELLQDGRDTCGRDVLLVIELRQAERTNARIVYNLNRVDLRYGTAGTCAQTQVFSNDVVGTATFSTVLKQTGSVCEVYIRTDWSERQSGSTWTARWDNRVIALNKYSFVIAQIAPVAGKHQTPLTFVGVP